MSLLELTAGERRALAASEPLTTLDPLLRHEILRRCAVRRYVHGDWVAAADQPARDWCCCLGGAVKVAQGSGEDDVLAYLRPGTWFGELALLGEAGHPHDLTAYGALTIAALPGAEFRRLLRQRHDFASALLRRQAGQVQALLDDIGSLRKLQLRARVARQLVRLAGIAHPGAERGARDGACVGLTQGELARVVGASRQRVNGALKSMERERLIVPGVDGIHIPDIDALRAVRD